MKLNCIIDSKGYKAKPSNSEMGAINNRIVRADKQTLSINELVNNLRAGKPYLAGHLINKANGRKKNNIENINFMSLDIDNHYKNKEKKDIYTNYSLEQVVDHLEKLLDIKPLITYTTFTGVNEHNNSKRFRLIYGLNKSTDSEGIQLLLKHIVEHSNDMFDTACIDSSRIFQATNREVKGYKDYKLLDTSIINELVEEERKKQKQLEKIRLEEKAKNEARRKAQGYDPNSSDDVIAELKQQDLGEYLRGQGYQVNTHGNGYESSCPIHNGNNKKNFVINYNNGAWVYHCFSGCGGTGGSIIDLHMQLNNLDNGQAIKELCEMYNIQQARPNLRPSILTTTDSKAYEIDKYISEDKKVVEDILESLENNKKTLVIAPMGTGKSTLIIKKVYPVFKEKDILVINVVPNIILLDNMKHKQGMKVIHSNSRDKYTDDTIIATTPESLPKLIQDLNGKQFALIVDETHQKGIDIYRDGYKEMRIGKAESMKNCISSLHLTATPTSLAFESFDKEIKIISKNPIKNKVKIINVAGNINDNLLDMTKKYTDHGVQVVLFNDWIEGNKDLKEKLLEYNPKLSIELVNSDMEKSENIKEGRVIADVTITTSSLMAGIDLEVRDRDNAILIENTIDKNIDNMIQLIGRFRSGINVNMVKRKSKTEIPYKTFEELLLRQMNMSNKVVDIANSDIDFHEDLNLETENLIDTEDSAVRKYCLEFDKNTKKWIINQAELRSKVSKIWSRELYKHEEELIQYLKKQTAFEVIGGIKVISHENMKETIMSDLQKLKKEERKQRKKKIVEKLMGIDELELLALLEGTYYHIDDKELVDVFIEYKHLCKKDMKEIEKIQGFFYSESEIVRAFKKFHTEKPVDIKRQMAEINAIKINHKIREHGMDLLLKLDNEGITNTMDVRQCKIRHLLQDIEKRQATVTDKKLKEITEILIKDGNLGYGKSVKNVLDRKEGYKKDLQSLGESVRSQLGNIYNFKSDGRISSVKL